MVVGVLDLELKAALRAPGRSLAIAIYGAAILVVVILWAAMRMPALGVHFVPAGERVQVVDADGLVRMDLPHDAPVSVIGPDAVITGAAEEFLQDYVPDPARTEVSRWYAERTWMARWTDQPLELKGPGVPSLTTSPPVARTLGDLSIDVWLLLGGGTAVLLLGAWVGSLRPKDWGARTFFMASSGVALCAYSGALYDARELTADGTLLRVLITLNFIGNNLGLGGTLAQFALFPRRLAPTWIIWPLVAVETVWGLAGGCGWLSAGAYYAGLLAHLPLIVVAIALQWRATVGDPGDRAILRWVGATTALGTGVLISGMAAPKLLGVPSLATDGFAFLPLLVVYGGMAVAVGRLKLFDLDRWAYRLILAALAAAAFLALDATLALAIHVEGPLAFTIALMVIAAAYMPLRAIAWRRIMGGRQMDQAELFEAAARVAFHPKPDERRADWGKLLGSIFDPLQILPSPAPAHTPTLSADRLELVIPPAADQTALVLRLPNQGRRLFGKDDQRLADQLVSLMARAEAARESYAKGVREERARIARDLHDDVSSRLLTSLHRQSVGDIRQDVRQAMGEIRLIFSGLAGDRVELDQLLADLRHETSERTAAAGVALDWPLADEDLEPRALPYEAYKALTSSMRELVTNSLKHGRPERLAVHMAVSGDQIRVTVTDHGGEPGAGGTSGGGKGLGNIRDRLAEAGGTFQFTQTEMGAHAALTLPLPPLSHPPVQGDDTEAAAT